MLTRHGDIVVVHDNSRPCTYSLWHVGADDQQVPGVADYTSTAMGQEAARQLARSLANKSKGAVFWLEKASGAWTAED